MSSQIEQSMNRRGLTLIEILVISLMVWLTIIGVVVGRHMIGRGWGGLIGGILGFLAFILFMCTFLLFHALMFEGIPFRPRCRRGCCRAKDYEVVARDNRFVAVCRCGDAYWRRGKQFMAIVDGREVPYMKWRSFRGWYPDETTAEGKSDH